MKRLAILLLACAILLCACGSTESAGVVAAEDPEDYETEYCVFPTTDAAFIGDTMPYFEDGKMNVFYLADQRAGTTGYHPWALLRTEDYCTYEDMGIVIPYADDFQAQDIALGTGCVMKDQSGLYHAFYTGHNDMLEPHEAIMHATSSDMLSWTKIPGDTFIAGDNYSTNDFRDPYVFYVPEENCYWMLVVTRCEGNGVIVKYTSTDLSKWTDAGILFTDDLGYGTNMECPTLIQYGGKWYLSFSDQWPDRVVHYRIADSINGPFVKPEQDTVDGNGFYAGRMETDGENLYIVGWNATKVGHDDYNDYDWAGNMIIHQLKQQPDGTLKPIVNEKIVETLNHQLPLVPVAMTQDVQAEGNNYNLPNNKYQFVQFDSIWGSCRLEADVTGFGSDGLFGISFNPDMDEYAGALNYVFDAAEDRIGFYNTEKLFEQDPQSSMSYSFTGKDSIHMTLLICDGIASLYVDDELALTARMYRSQGTRWQLFSANDQVQWQNVTLYK